MLNAYETRVDDLIAFDATLSARNNIDQARIRGLEAVIGTKLGARGINTSPTLLDPENRSSGVNDGNVLPRRASGANTTHKVTAAR
jgi:vitamin B12 transporter